MNVYTYIYIYIYIVFELPSRDAALDALNRWVAETSFEPMLPLLSTALNMETLIYIYIYIYIYICVCVCVCVCV